MDHQEDSYQNDYWRQSGEYSSQVYIKKEPQDQPQDMPEVESSNRASASELASNFLSTLKIEQEVYIKSETPETAGDTKASHGDRSRDRSERQRSKEEDDRERRERKRDRDRDREKDRGDRSDRDKERDRDRERERDRDKDKDKDRDRDRDRDRERDRDRDRGEKDREREKERDKERERDRGDRDRDRDRDNENGRRRRERDRDRDRERSRERLRREREEREERESRRSRRSRRRSRSYSPRRRSHSPRHRSRSRSITPINRRRRKLNNWDVPPPGYEGMTAEQVKATGHFPLPGQPASTRPAAVPTSPVIPGMDPSRAAMMMGMTHELPPRPKVSQGAAGPVAQTASLARQARRLYVGNIPYGIDENGLSDFFNSTMVQLNITTAPGNPVIAVQINHDKNYAFVEFRAPEEATAAMAFDGITFQGQSLKIRRPKDYQPPPGQNLEPPPIHVPGVVSTNVPDSPNKIFIGGLPTYLNDEQVMELLKSFGELRAFNLVKDSLTGVSKGFAFCEYVDPTVTDLACQGLNNMELGDRKLVVQRASVGSAKNAGVTNVLSTSVLIPTGNGEMQPTTVLQLLNMVTPEELVEDEEYEDIFDDVREECSKFGNVIDMKIPRPGHGGSATGIGKIFVRYESIDEAGIALRALAGRKFAERTVLTSYINEDTYFAEDF